MVKLFNEDEKCMSAAGLPISIYADNRVGEEELLNRTTNLRPRMIDGVELALDTIHDGNFFQLREQFFVSNKLFKRKRWLS